MSKQDGGPVLYFKVSAQDYKRVAALGWRLGTNGYVYCRSRKHPHALLHRFVVDAPIGTEVHHVNGNRLDNRRENLEVLRPGEHQRQHHAPDLAARNRARRQYPLTGICPECGTPFTKHPDHRGRQRLCSKLCAIRKAARISAERSRTHD